MIRFQIIERPGAELQKTLVDAMRDGGLRTFIALKRGRKIEHATKPGWMNWTSHDGVLQCEVISPQKPGLEWQLFSAFLGRLADRYADRIVAINVQFPDTIGASDQPPRRRKRHALSGRRRG